VVASEFFGALAEREFRNLYFARAFSLFGDGIAPVALAIAVLKTLDWSPAALGYVLGVRTAALVAFVLIAGVVADRLPRRVILMSSDLLRFAAQGATAALILTKRATLAELMILAFAYGLGDAFFRPTSTGIVPQTISRERLQQAMAMIAMTQSSFTVLGPVVAGTLAVTVGPGWAIAIDSVTFLVSAAFVARLSRLPRAPAGAGFLRELREGWAVFTGRTWLWVDGVFSAIGNCIIFAPFLVLGPAIVLNALHSTGGWPAITAAFGGGSIAGGFLLLRARPTRPLLAGVPLLALLALPTGLLAAEAPIAAIAVGAFAGGLGLSVFNTLFETTVQRMVPPEAVSRVSSIVWMLSASLLPLGFAAAGWVASYIGIHETLTAAAVWAVAATAIVVAIPDVRNLRYEPPAPAEAEPALEAEPA
jgi:predicted MFS family arabinose efflux permease